MNKITWTKLGFLILFGSYFVLDCHRLLNNILKQQIVIRNKKFLMQDHNNPTRLF